MFMEETRRKMYCNALLGILKNKALSSADTQAKDFKDWKRSFSSSLLSMQTQCVAANVLQMKDRSWGKWMLILPSYPDERHSSPSVPRPIFSRSPCCFPS
uniref:Uncharacterized protein n=1 Tax=Papio anubis TaxID=9555 RepID=A0A8I5NMR7_PAPAN